MDDSEVTLNVCLGKEFSGGELFFRGSRCEKHVNTGSQPEVSHGDGITEQFGTINYRSYIFFALKESNIYIKKVV